jgi:hypothetical protein
MREIIFRGKFGAYWHYGDLQHALNGRVYMLERQGNGGESVVEVDPATVGQFTGSLDKNGVKIFEGDIIKVKRTKYEIVYSSGCLFAKIKKGNTTYHKIIPGLGLNDTVVIGNIHDNPELLEGAVK